MSLLARINRPIVARVAARRPRFGIGEGVVVLETPGGESRTLRLADLIGAILSYRNVYAYDAIVLTLLFSDRTVIEILQDDPCWFDLTSELDRSGKIAAPSKDWQVQFLAAGVGSPPLDLLKLL